MFRGVSVERVGQGRDYHGVAPGNTLIFTGQPNGRSPHGPVVMHPIAPGGLLLIQCVGVRKRSFPQPGWARRFGRNHHDRAGIHKNGSVGQQMSAVVIEPAIGEIAHQPWGPPCVPTIGRTASPRIEQRMMVIPGEVVRRTMKERQQIAIGRLDKGRVACIPARLTVDGVSFGNTKLHGFITSFHIGSSPLLQTEQPPLCRFHGNGVTWCELPLGL